MNLNPQHRKLITTISKKKSLPEEKFLFLLLLDEYERTFNKQYPVWWELTPPVHRHDWLRGVPTRWSLPCDGDYVLDGNWPLRRGLGMWRICWIYWIDLCAGRLCDATDWVAVDAGAGGLVCLSKRSADKFTRSLCKKFVSGFCWSALLRKLL